MDFRLELLFTGVITGTWYVADDDLSDFSNDFCKWYIDILFCRLVFHKNIIYLFNQHNFRLFISHSWGIGYGLNQYFYLIFWSFLFDFRLCNLWIFKFWFLGECSLLCGEFFARFCDPMGFSIDFGNRSTEWHFIRGIFLMVPCIFIWLKWFIVKLCDF